MNIGDRMVMRRAARMIKLLVAALPETDLTARAEAVTETIMTRTEMPLEQGETIRHEG